MKKVIGYSIIFLITTFGIGTFMFWLAHPILLDYWESVSRTAITLAIVATGYSLFVFALKLINGEE